MQHRCASGRAEHQNMAWPQLVQAFVNAMRRRNVVVAEIKSEDVAIDIAIKTRVLSNGLQLRTKNKVPAYMAVIKRLDSQPVADQIKLSFLAVPKGKGKHADEPLGR